MFLFDTQFTESFELLSALVPVPLSPKQTDRPELVAELPFQRKVDAKPCRKLAADPWEVVVLVAVAVYLIFLRSGLLQMQTMNLNNRRFEPNALTLRQSRGLFTDQQQLHFFYCLLLYII